jgi:hypothetical protein
MGIPFFKLHPTKQQKKKDTFGNRHFELHFKKIGIDLITTKGKRFSILKTIK